MGEAVISAMEIEKENKEEEKKDGSSEVVSWEKFMPKIALKVLLVEADDSTRHIISALLRKCSYKGTPSISLCVCEAMFRWMILVRFCL